LSFTSINKTHKFFTFRKRKKKKKINEFF